MIIEPSSIADATLFKRILREHNVGFLDFGCSHGQGVLGVQSKTKNVGLGFDTDPKKLALADAKGVLCSNYNILVLPDEHLVPYTTIFHMLEHLDSVSEARKYIAKACVVSAENVFIKQPYFDADPWLFHNGLKLFYSDWTGHRNRMTTPDFYFMLRSLRVQGLISEFVIGYKLPITNSDSDKIHSLESPIDSLDYDSEKHPPKPRNFPINFPLYYEIQVAIDINGGGNGALWEKMSPEYIAFDSRHDRHKNPCLNFSVSK